ncbi:MAG: biopolymer transporter ExbD [Bacteroidales bacterium]|nr:biopolymer transporter ExbD [Bacteroidales bacterium]
MAIKLRNKRSLEFSTASMSDLVFLLLVFFILTSTLVSPNVIPLLLPNSNSPSPIETQNVTVYINDQFQYFVEEADNQVAEDGLFAEISQRMNGLQKGNVVLRADKSVPVQYVVVVIDAVNQLNSQNNTNYKVILATEQK